MTNQEYREMQKRLTLMQNPKWRSVIAQLKQFESEKNKNYRIIYKKDNQKKPRSESFDKVQYVDETYSFIFNDGFVLKDIDIIDIQKIDFKDFMYDFFS